MRRPRSTATLVLVAAAAAGAIIAQLVAGKAIRDAWFLASFPVTALPGIIVASAVLSLATGLPAVRLLARLGPGRLITAGSLLSAALLLVQWALAMVDPRIVAVTLYIHVAIFGGILISAFWSFVTERFDPWTAKLSMPRIAGGATLGGLFGGVLAERVGTISMEAMLPALAILQIAVAAGAWMLRSDTPSGLPDAEAGSVTRACQAVGRSRYLRQLASLVLLGTLGAALLDYALKANAVARFTGEHDLVRFFAIFHTVVSLATFVVQIVLSRVFLERVGLARTAAALPGCVTVGSLASLIFPGLPAIALARGTEAVLRSSAYRSAYELLFAPIPPEDKRSTKTVIDVAFDRLGDALGGGAAKLILVVVPAAATEAMLGLAALVSLAAMWIARELHLGYIAALESSLIDHAGRLNVQEDSSSTEAFFGEPVFPGASAFAPASRAAADPVWQALENLRSPDSHVVLRQLRAAESVDSALVPQLISLLARDDVAQEAARVLALSGSRIVGQLADHLLDPNEDFAIRRRIPRILATRPARVAVRPLMDGLSDARFEVRFQCGRALARLDAQGPISIDRDAVFRAVEREVAVERRVWESQRLLERIEGDEESVFVDEFLKDRADRSLEHVFTLLSLVLPREPLRIAFRGLHLDDAGLRGTALEYLNSVLPDAIRERLWPFFEETREAAHPNRTREEIIDALLESNESIQISLEELRRRHARKTGAPED